MNERTPSPEVRVLPDTAALYRAGAEAFAAAAARAVAARGRFVVALSGGSTPKGLFALLAGDAALRAVVPWEKLHVFWGDERPVGPDHVESNYRMAREALLAHVPIPTAQIHRIRGEAPDPAQAAAEYEATLREALGALTGGSGGSADTPPVFDLVLLGMGPDGHTASLFPGTTALAETRRLVVSNWVGKLDTERITLTAPALNAARHVLFVVGGDDKAPALKSVLEGRFEPQQLPAQLIHPEAGTLTWLVDAAAARLLSAGTAGRV